MLKTRLWAAHHLDRWESRVRRVAENWGWPQAWLRELQAYLAQPRMTPEEFWVRYTLKRMAAEPLLDHLMTEREALDFYRTSDYPFWRNLVHRRHSAWRRVLVTMAQPDGLFVEYGCGTAPVTRFVAAHRPRWTYGLIDVEGPARAYGAWWIAVRHDGAPDEYHFRHAVESVEWLDDRMWAQVNVITALDVFEHLADPEPIARMLVDRLAPAGYLHWNFVGNPRQYDLDLATEAQRQATCAYLSGALDLVWEREGYRVSRRR